MANSIDRRVKRLRSKTEARKFSWLRYLDQWRGDRAAGFYAFVWNWRRKRQPEK